MKKMKVPPTCRIVKMIKRMRSNTAAANFQSLLSSLSLTVLLQSSDLLRFFVFSRSRISIMTISRLSVVSDVMPCGRCTLSWKSPSSLMSFMQTADGIDFVESLKCSHGASFSRTSRFICSYTSARMIETHSCQSYV